MTEPQQQQQQQQQVHAAFSTMAPGADAKLPPRVSYGDAADDDYIPIPLVIDTVAVVEDDIAHIVSQSPFLQHEMATASKDAVTLLHRSEIITGACLGRGGFSDVVEIVGLGLQARYSARVTPAQQAQRERLQKEVHTGRRRLVLKHLQEDLVHAHTNPKHNPRYGDEPDHEAAWAFAQAACDLVREATYLSALNHPNICRLRGLPLDGLRAWNQKGQDGRPTHDGFFLILDRLDCTLEERIEEWTKQAPMRNDDLLFQKADYALQLADALCYLHDRGIIFRDLKPQNIGFIDTGRLQLFDFGLCRELPASQLRRHQSEPSTPTRIPRGNVSEEEEESVSEENKEERDLDEKKEESTTCTTWSYHRDDEVFVMSGVGTRRYMAVEVVNSMCYNCKADVYSWSMVVWEMLALETPFSGFTIDDHTHWVCRAGYRPALDPNWPPAICDIVSCAWKSSVYQRWSMRQVAQHLQYFLQSSYDVLAPSYSPVGVTEDLALFCQTKQEDHGSPHREYYRSTSPPELLFPTPPSAVRGSRVKEEDEVWNAVASVVEEDDNEEEDNRMLEHLALPSLRTMTSSSSSSSTPSKKTEKPDACSSIVRTAEEDGDRQGLPSGWNSCVAMALPEFCETLDFCRRAVSRRAPTMDVGVFFRSAALVDSSFSSGSLSHDEEDEESSRQQQPAQHNTVATTFPSFRPRVEQYELPRAVVVPNH